MDTKRESIIEVGIMISEERKREIEQLYALGRRTKESVDGMEGFTDLMSNMNDIRRATEKIEKFFASATFEEMHYYLQQGQGTDSVALWSAIRILFNEVATLKKTAGV